MSVITEEALVFPASYAQQRLWLLDQLDPGSPAYNVPTVTRLRGRLDIAALEAALDEVVRRHESLRTTLPQEAGAPVQVIAPELHLTLRREDLSSLPESERAATAKRLAKEEARLPFDLSAGPLVRARLLGLGEEEHLLLITLHHVITDGWSTGVLYSELSALYGAFSRGEESPLEELPIQYADYASWQR